MIKLLFLCYCHCYPARQQTGIKKVIELNDRAVELMSQQFMACGVDSFLMDSIYKAALVLLDKAVLKDSTNPTVAANKFRLKDYDSAIATLEKFENCKGSLDPVLRLGLSFCYIKKGEIDKAQEVWLLSLQRVSNEFLINGDSANYYFTRYFIDGKGYKKY